MSQTVKFKINKFEANALWLIYGGAALVTGYFNSQMRDPFNSPKFILILLLNAWLLGHLVAYLKELRDYKLKRFFLILISIFVLLFFVSALASEDKYTAFIGTFQRRNGFLNYLALAIFSLSAALYARFSNIKRLFNIVFVFATALIAYGYAQANGKDFVNWNNPYNSIISTVGNPNFAAAVMAIFATIAFCAVFVAELNIVIRVIFAIESIAFIHLIFLSNSRQGLLAFGLGVTVFLTYLAYEKNKNFGILASIGTIFIVVVSTLGMLQKGPLADLLYKPSVSVRGYYWRAAIKMIQDHPIFGVGIDKYASYFKEYREVGYPLNYGFTITSSNAHNVPLQIASTGGLMLGLVYIAINIFILTVSVKGLRKVSGSPKVVFLAIFASWLAFQAQSIISIDNIGITIWGWMLGGILVALSSSVIDDQKEPNKETKRAKNQIYNFKQLSFSVVFLIPALIYSTFAYSAERDMWKQPQLITSGGQNPEFYKLAKQTFENPFTDPQFKLETSINLYQQGYKEEAIKNLSDLEKADPRNLDILELNAQLFESTGEVSKANEFRLKIAQYDPFNAINFLKMGRNYKTLGDLVNQKIMLEKIISFAPNTNEANTARTELG
jgi:O-antigen ligase